MPAATFCSEKRLSLEIGWHSHFPVAVATLRPLDTPASLCAEYACRLCVAWLPNTSEKAF
jgi:hypothetical protein